MTEKKEWRNSESINETFERHGINTDPMSSEEKPIEMREEKTFLKFAQDECGGRYDIKDILYQLDENEITDMVEAYASYKLNQYASQLSVERETVSDEMICIKQDDWDAYYLKAKELRENHKDNDYIFNSFGYMISLMEKLLTYNVNKAQAVVKESKCEGAHEIDEGKSVCKHCGEIYHHSPSPPTSVKEKTNA